jgi:1-acyl-sn-glycerol-3-phosphate acyltransferase
VSVLRSLLITDPLIILATILYWSASQIASLFDATGRKQASIASAWARALLRLSRVKVKVEGLEKIATDKNYIFVANHLSYMDTPVFLANIPVQFRFLAKRGLFQVPFLGWHLKRAGHIPVPRGDARAAVRMMNTAAQMVRERGISLLIFPEGGRSRDGSLGQFKEGGAYIAIQASVPLVPVALMGTREVLPFGSGHIQKGNVTMRIGDPIPTDQASPRDRVRLTTELRHQIQSLQEAQPIHV